jgi:hypothetical protein
MRVKEPAPVLPIFRRFPFKRGSLALEQWQHNECPRGRVDHGERQQVVSGKPLMTPPLVWCRGVGVAVSVTVSRSLNRCP